MMDNRSDNSNFKQRNKISHQEEDKKKTENMFAKRNKNIYRLTKFCATKYMSFK